RTSRSYDYQKYGDVVTFDTTYRTNLYNLPFGLFIGINKHFQSIVLGGVLLTHETTADFEWAFSTFVEIMGGKAPRTILTDQCQAMATALASKLKTTRHRWCRWHVLHKAKQKLGPVYSMTSTQRSESANHMLKRYIQRSALMHVFVSKFSEFQSDRNVQEDREEHITKQVSRRTRIGVPIELHAQTVYTRAMYVIDSHPRSKDDDNPRKTCVRFNGLDKVTCDCGMYEHMGMLCRHCLKVVGAHDPSPLVPFQVLVHRDMTQIPPLNIMPRWTKSHGATDKELYKDCQSSCLEVADIARKRLVLKRVLQLSSSCKGMDNAIFIHAMQQLDSVSRPSLSVSEGAVISANPPQLWHGELPTKCPPRTQRKGRRQSTSLKSWMRQGKAAARKKTMRSVPPCPPSTTDEENPRGC
ncbi:hypothetical protein U9M48_030641, partial [Paspalum notatum var. saurae]